MLKKVTEARIKTFAENESGATAIEYALIASGIALAIIAGITAVGGGVSSFFTSLAGMV